MDEETTFTDLAGRRFGPYLLLERIGRGGMGDVYRGRDQRLNRFVAVKAVRPDLAADGMARDRFLRETKIAPLVSHPYIATVYDVLEEEGRLLLVMELVEGQRIDEAARAQKAPPARIATWAAEIAEALAAIHRTGLIHRDLKPSNVLVDRSGHVKVMDFGLARRMTAPLNATAAPTGSGPPSITGEGVAVGTLRYMSPEQLCGQPLDARSDLFSLGVLLFELAAGRHPFERDTPYDLAGAILNAPARDARGAAELGKLGALGDVVMRLLERDPGRRIASAEEVARLLHEASRSTPALAVRGRPARDARRRAWLAIGTMTAVLVSAVVLVSLRRDRPDQPVRPLVAVLPFVDPTGGAESAVRAEIAAQLLSAALAENSALRVIPWRRVRDELGAATDGGSPAQRAERIRRQLSPTLIVDGSLWREGKRWLATLEVAGAKEGVSPAFRVAADHLSEVVSLAASRIAQDALPGPARPSRPAPAPAPPSDESLALLHRAQDRMRQGRYVEAIRLLEDLAAREPSASAIRLALAEVLDLAGYGKRARDAIAETIRLMKEEGLDLESPARIRAQAVRARIDGDYRTLVAALRLLVGRGQEDVDTLAALAEALFSSGQRGEALEAIDRALSGDPNDPQARLKKGRFLVHAGRVEEASPEFDLAEQRYRELRSAEGEAEVLLARGRAQYRLGRLAAAEDLFRSAMARFQLSGLPVRGATAALWAGNVAIAEGRLEVAQERYRTAYEIAQASGDNRVVVHSLNGMAQSLLSAGRTREAEARAVLAVDEARILANPSLLLEPLLGLASTILYRGRAEEGQALAEEARAIAVAQQNRARELDALALIADSLWQRGQHEPARSLYRSVIERNEAGEGPADALAARYQAIAELAEVTGETASGLEWSEKALAAAERLRSDSLQGYALGLRAQLLAAVARFDEADALLGRASEKLSSGTYRMDDLDARIWLTRGSSLLYRGRFEEARPLLERARLLGVKTGARRLQATALVLLAEAALGGGDARLGLELARQAHRVENSLPIERAAAGAIEARALHLLGRGQEAGAAWSAAASLCERLDAPLLTAIVSAIGVQVNSARDVAGRERIAARGRRAYQAYLEAAPADRREAMKQRSDLVHVERSLSGA